MSPILKLKRQIRAIRAATLQCMGGVASTDYLHHSGKVLVVAPHPDDETFGVGGLIASIASDVPDNDRRREVQVLFLTSGGKSHSGCCKILTSDLETRREAAARRASQVLGVKEENLHFFRLTDGGLPHPNMPGYMDALARITGFMAKLKPDVVFVPHPYEGWSDHVAAEQLVQSAITSLPERLRSPGSSYNGVPKLFYYCVWFWFSMPLRRAWSLRWSNAVTINLKTHTKNRDFTCRDISPHQLKLAAMKVYLDDICPCGKPSCGVLPRELVCALEWERELFFGNGRKEV